MRIKDVIVGLVVSCLTLLLPCFAMAQGWEQVSNIAGGDDVALSVATTRDGGYVLTGYTDKSKGFIGRLDADGALLWRVPLSADNFETWGKSVIQTQDDNFVVAGFSNSGGSGQRDVFVAKIDANGRKLWEKFFGYGNEDEGFQVREAANGDLVVAGYSEDNDKDRDFYALRLKASGATIWEKIIGAKNAADEAHALEIAANGNIFLVGYTQVSKLNKDVQLVRIDANGGVLLTKSILSTAEPEDANAIIQTSKGSLLVGGFTGNKKRAYLLEISIDGSILGNIPINSTYESAINSITNANDGGFVVTGFVDEITNIWALVIKTKADGTLVWEKKFGTKGTPSTTPSSMGFSIASVAAGGYIVVGSRSKDISELSESDNIYLLKLDENGMTYTKIARGKVFNDANSNCTLNTNERGLKGWLIQAENAQRQKIFATTDVAGNYELLADANAYKISLVPPNPYWTACQGIYNIDFSTQDTVALSFAARPTIACPYLTVDVSTPVLRRCVENPYTIRYCNTGTRPALNAYLTVTVDTFLLVNGSDLAWDAKSGDTYTFRLGDIYQGDCNSFTLNTTLNCNATINGQTHFVKAHIYPDSLCLPVSSLWDKSSLQVDSYLEKDAVMLRVKNVGKGNMKLEGKYDVVEDDVIERRVPIKLKQNETRIERLPANGKTYRIFVTQSAGHPGKSSPTVAVESRAENGVPSSLGYVTQFSEDDADAFIDIDAQESAEKPKSIELRGYPKGFSSENYVTDSTEVEYIIHFQNTGKDTVRHVVVRDTLSPYFDVTSFRAGTSSHPYEWEVYRNGIVKFTMTDVKIPTSSQNEKASHGFVKFRIAQPAQPRNTAGTVIYNRASVHLNYRVASRTARTRHKIVSDLFSVITDNREVAFPNAKISVSPNPFVAETFFEIQGVDYQQGIFSLYDVMGQPVRTEQFSGTKFQFLRNDLPAGIYFYRLMLDGKLAGSGKIMTVR